MPGNGDNVVFNSSSHINCIVYTSEVQIASLTIESTYNGVVSISNNNGAPALIASGLTITNANSFNSGNATFQFSGSSITVNTAASLFAVTISGGAVINLYQDLLVQYGLNIYNVVQMNSIGGSNKIKVEGSIYSIDTDWGHSGTPAYVSAVGTGTQTIGGSGKICYFEYAKPSGGLDITASMPYTFKDVVVSLGTWDLNNGVINSDNGFTVQGGVITGNGTLNGNVVCNSGGISPGNTIGCITINGNLTMNAGSVLTINGNGSTACSQIDQLVVNGTVSLNSPTLTSVGTMASLQTLATIILNDGTDTVSNTFNGMADGATITLGGNTYTISYNNATGNDVVLESYCGTPQFTQCPDNQMFTLGSGTCSTALTYTVTATSVPSPTYSYSFSGATNATGSGTGSGAAFNVGTTYVTVMASSCSTSGTSSCQFEVLVIDTTKPTAICKNATVYLNASGVATLATADVNNGSYDNCKQVSLSLNKTSFTCSDAGSQNVTLTVTEVQQASTIKVVNPPSGVIGHWTFESGITTTDLTGNWANLSVTGNASITNGVLDVNSGGYARAAGYTGSTITNKTLVSYVRLDNINLYGGSAMTIDKINSDMFDGIVYGERQPKKWMNGSSGWARTQDLNPGYTESTSNQLIQMAVTYQVSGSNVTVTAYRNGQSIGSYTSANAASWSAGDAEIIFGARHIDGGNVNGEMDAKIEEALLFNRALSQQEIQNLGNGLSSTCTATVTVLDTIKPTLSCPSNKTVSATNAAGAVVTYTAPVATDNCAGVTTSRITGFPSGATFPIGTTTVTHAATDGSGNTSVCSFTVTVIGIAPVVQCPGDIQINTATGNCSAPVTYSAVDTTGVPASTITYSIAPGSSFATGTTQVTATATNSIGSSSCTFAVTVTDNQTPTVITKNITANLNTSGNVTIVSADVDNGTTDNCGIASITVSPDSFTCSNVGNNTVTLTVTDIHGNTSSGTAVVAIADNTAPSVITQGITVELGADGQTTISASQIDNGSGDVCGIASMSVTPSTFTCGNLGTNTVTLTVTDNNGNTASALATVTVVDTTAPVVTTAVPNTISVCGAQSITWNEPQSSDVCGVTVTRSHVPGSTFGVGTTTVTYTWSDPSGNTTTRSFLVNVYHKPTLTISVSALPDYCQGVAKLSASVSNVAQLQQPVTYSWSGGLGSAQEVSVQANGTYSVTVTDARGCSATESYMLNQNTVTTASAYVLISNKKVQLLHSTVNGNVGVRCVTSCSNNDDDEEEQNCGKARIQNSSVVTGFVRASVIRVTGGSTVGSQSTGSTSVTLPEFPSFTNTANNNITVNQGQSATLTGSSYKNITIKQGATVTFTAASVNIRKLTTESNATINFNQDATLFVKQNVELDENNSVNVSGKRVILYADNDVIVKKGSNIKCVVYTTGKLDVVGSQSQPTTMTGMFISCQRIKSENYITWNAGASCSFLGSGSARHIAEESLDENIQTEALPSNTQDVVVSPNPATDKLTIDYNGFNQQQVSITIRDLFGRTIIKSTPPTTANSAEFDITELVSGHYSVVVESATAKAVQSLIITK